MILRALLLFFAASVSLQPSFAEWPDRHGPNHDGVVDVEAARGLPTVWSATKNVAWRTPVHDEGHSSPVILEGRVWLTAATADGKKQYVICIDEKTGEILHDKLLFENDEVESLGGAQGFNNYAAPSCVLAPGAVYVHFGTYGTARLDAESAEVVWQRRDLPCRHFRGPGSSPVLFNDKLVLTFDGVDQQYTTVLDAETGQTLWRTDRSTDYNDLDASGLPEREGDMRKAYCTPAVVDLNGQTQILSVGSRAMQSYDLATGKELWTLRHKDYNATMRPLWLATEGLVLINTGSRGAKLIAVKVDDALAGDITDSHVVWSRDQGNPRFAKPVYYNGMVFQISDNGVVFCIDAVTGEEIWKDRARGDYRGSPILIGDLIYFFSEQGRGTVLKATNVFQEVAVNEVASMGTTACPAVSNGALFIRGKEHLVKIQHP